MAAVQKARGLEQPLFLAWEDRLHRLRRNSRTIINFRMAVRPFEDYLTALRVTPEKVEPWQVEDYFAELDLAASTKRNHLSSIRAAYSYALRRGAISHDPTLDIEIERIPDEEPIVIPNDELRAMRAKVWTEQGILMFHLLAYTGMRRHEIRKLIWGDVLLDEGTIRVLGKGGKLRLVPIHPALGEQLAWAKTTAEPAPDDYVLRGRYRTLPVSFGTFSEIVREFTEDYTPHDFRRTVASSLAYNGVSDPLIDKIMGWAPRTVGRRYYIRTATPDMQRAILKAYEDDPI
jgi:integrase